MTKPTVQPAFLVHSSSVYAACSGHYVYLKIISAQFICTYSEYTSVNAYRFPPVERSESLMPAQRVAALLRMIKRI